MRARLWLVLCALRPLAANATDVSAEVGTSVLTASDANPRTGSASVNGAFSYSLHETFELGASLQYTRDFATKTAETSSNGSNIFMLGLSAIYAPTEHWFGLLLLNGTPPTNQRNATTVSFNQRSADIVVDSRDWSLGGLLTGGWSSAGLSDFESTVDLITQVNYLSVFQQAELPNTPAGEQLTAACTTALLRKTPLCHLVRGTSTPLWQVRLGASYTATLFTRTDVALEGVYYLYDRDPNDVGYFSIAALGNLPLGVGLPLLPLQLALKPSLVHRFEHFTLRTWYQFGLYTNSQGSNHALNLKLTWKATRNMRVWLSATGQLDATQNGVGSPAATFTLGALYSW